ncbi:uncharacterized protein [Dermacentor andersoni]|uniref:uncharacterized protein n=1 Tax=Dermacentor andersoni TaxID=34620 RepID=UPI002415DBE5|nr:uncharacterized protein LOC126540803 [Dermacentor andersoni]
MPPVRCLLTVPHLRAKRSYTLQDGSLEALKQAVATCPVLGSLVALSSRKFQVLDPTFNEYVDLAADDNIPDMAKIIVDAQQESVAEGAPSCSSSQVNFIAEVHIKGHFGNLCTEQTQPSSSDDDGVNFVMPSLGALHEKVISGEALTSSSFRQITDILFGAMASTTLFPTRQFYNKVTSLLLDKYPQLPDVGSGSDSWKVALRNKFKNQRRKLQDNRALQNREKFGAQRRTEAAAKELQRSKKPKMAIGLPNLKGEDETSISKHEEWLILESKKSLPNEKAMQERMALTANQRLPDLAKSTVLDVKMKYPYLMEFQRLTKKLVDHSS